MPKAHFLFPIAVSFLFAFLFGCASAPTVGEFSDRELMRAACPLDFAKKVTGSIWTKIESKEISGQFPATVLVDYPERLAVEVTNLIGSPQAWLTIDHGKSVLKFTPENEKQYGRPSRVQDRLGGLPLELAPRLFAGGVPCPSDNKNQNIRVKQTEGGGLEVIALDLRTHASTRYVYFFTKRGGRPWVREANWEKIAREGQSSAKSNLVRIVREEPLDPDGAPRRWTASSNGGEIRVRWKDRAVSAIDRGQRVESVVK
jgi:hypothetical protein